MLSSSPEREGSLRFFERITEVTLEEEEEEEGVCGGDDIISVSRLLELILVVS